MEKLQQAPTEEAQIAILETLAQDLPITNRTVRGGKKLFSPPQLLLLLLTLSYNI